MLWGCQDEMPLVPRVGLLIVLAAAGLSALEIDLSPPQIEEALSIARSTERERARFHAPYIQRVDTEFVERAELVSELRRVVLLAEERGSKGDRRFAYSISQATAALEPWRRRVSVVAHIRFHPQNNYVNMPDVDISLPGREGTLLGVVRAPVLSLPSTPGDRLPVLGAVVEGIFDAPAIADGPREFVISLEGKELGRVTFDLAALR